MGETLKWIVIIEKNLLSGVWNYIRIWRESNYHQGATKNFPLINPRSLMYESVSRSNYDSRFFTRAVSKSSPGNGISFFTVQHKVPLTLNTIERAQSRIIVELVASICRWHLRRERAAVCSKTSFDRGREREREGKLIPSKCHRPVRPRVWMIKGNIFVHFVCTSRRKPYPVLHSSFSLMALFQGGAAACRWMVMARDEVVDGNLSFPEKAELLGAWLLSGIMMTSCYSRA